MLRCYDVLCQNGHTNEVFVPSGADEIPCPDCGTPSRKLPSGTRCKLDAVSGHFPGALYKWERMHEEAARRPSNVDNQ